MRFDWSLFAICAAGLAVGVWAATDLQPATTSEVEKYKTESCEYRLIKVNNVAVDPKKKNPDLKDFYGVCTQCKNRNPLDNTQQTDQNCILNFEYKFIKHKKGKEDIEYTLFFERMPKDGVDKDRCKICPDGNPKFWRSLKRLDP